jgi:hypothetical protein
MNEGTPGVPRTDARQSTAAWLISAGRRAHAGGENGSSASSPWWCPASTAPDTTGASRGYRKIAAALCWRRWHRLSALDGHRYLSLDAVKTHRDALLGFTHEHYIAALAIGS